MRASEPRNLFTPADDPQHGVFFTRDVEALARAMGLGAHAPFLIDADAGPDPLPQGGETRLTFPNNHLSYAFTWFGLAVALARRIRRFRLRADAGGRGAAVGQAARPGPRVAAFGGGNASHRCGNSRLLSLKAVEDAADRGPCRKIHAGGATWASRVAALSGRRQRASACAARLDSGRSARPWPIDHQDRGQRRDFAPVPPAVKLREIVGAHDPHEARARAPGA